MPPKKAKRELPKRRYIEPIKKSNGTFDYPTLAVGPSDEEDKRGDGVYTLEPIPKNTVLFYYGVWLDQEEYDKRIKAGKGDYIIESGNKDIYVDANPDYQPKTDAYGTKIGGHGKFIGGKVNEASTGETENMVLSKVMYRNKYRPVLVAIRDIEQGEELITHYGSSFKRTYKVGRRAKFPWWWIRRNSAPVAT